MTSAPCHEDLKAYDYVLIVAPMGALGGYREVKYVIPSRGSAGEEKGGQDSDKKHWAVAFALYDYVQGVSKELYTFIQDTIIVNLVKPQNKEKPVKQEIIEQIKALLNCNDNNCIIDENLIDTLLKLEGKTSEAQKTIDRLKELRKEAKIHFVPGVITRWIEEVLVTWRGGNQFYDVLKGTLAYYILSALKEKSSHRNIAIFVDTSHGINYFVTALKEAVPLAATLYLIHRIADGEPVEKLDICSYNSDPYPTPSRECQSQKGGDAQKDKAEQADKETPSLKIHLVERFEMVYTHKSETETYTSINLYPVRSLVEDLFLTMGLKGIVNYLNQKWAIDEDKWMRITASVVLFLRGVLGWSLHIAHSSDKGMLVEIGEAVKKRRIRIEQRSDKNEIAITYVWGSNRKIGTDVVTFASIHSSLDRLGRCLATPKGIEGSTYVCYPIKKLEKYIEQFYAPPYREININELASVRDYLEGKKKSDESSVRDCPEEKSRDREYCKPLEGGKGFICGKKKDADQQAEGANPRNFYAHAGLSFELDWGALKEEGELLCFGNVKGAIDTLAKGG